MARKQPEITANTRQNLMDAYWELYTSDTVDRITVKMITDRAGYNRGTFYAYFLDIDDLQSQIEDELLPSEEEFKKLKEATIAKNSREILEIFMRIEEASGKKLGFLLGFRGNLSFQTKFNTTLKQLILKHLPLDLKESDEIIDYKTNILCSIFYETIRYWYECGNRLFSIEDMTTLMLETVFFGLVESKSID